MRYLCRIEIKDCYDFYWQAVWNECEDVAGAAQDAVHLFLERHPDIKQEDIFEVMVEAAPVRIENDASRFRPVTVTSIIDWKEV